MESREDVECPVTSFFLEAIKVIEDDRNEVLEYLERQKCCTTRMKKALFDDSRDKFSAKIAEAKRTFDDETVERVLDGLNRPFGIIRQEPQTNVHTSTD